MGRNIVLNITLINPYGQQIRGMILIRDGLAVSSFEDKTLAKQLYEAESKAGNKNISYDKERNSLIEKYPYRNADEIMHKIVKELKKSGGQAVEE